MGGKLEVFKNIGKENGSTTRMIGAMIQACYTCDVLYNLCRNKIARNIMKKNKI